MITNGDPRSRAITLSSIFLVAFAAAFFYFYSLDTMNDPVFGIDFVCFHEAGRILARGDIQHLTDYTESGGMMASKGPFLEHFHQYFFPGSKAATRWIYPPGYAWIFHPLAGFEFPAAARIWLVINTLITLGIFLLLADSRLKSRADHSLKYLRLAWYFFLVLTFQPMLDNAWHGQVTGLIFLFFCLGYWLYRREYCFWAGLVWGLMIPMKIYPVLILFYFVWKKEWRVVFGAIAGGIVILLISLMTAGAKGNWEYVQFLRNEMRGAWKPAFNNQSLSGFLMHVFTKGDISSWQNVEAPGWLAPIRFAIILAMLAGAGRAMLKRPGNDELCKNARDLDLSLIVFLMLLASPVTWYHYYYWLLFPIIILFDEMLLSPNKYAMKSLIWVGVGYALVSVQGLSAIYPLEAQSLQNIWMLRLGLSQSFIGAALLFIVLVMMRANYGCLPRESNCDVSRKV